MLLECKNEWANLSVIHPGVVSGIFAMNARLTVNDAGQITDTIGTGRCARNALNECNPYDGHLYVIDNSFMLYGISSGLSSPEPWMNKDEYDQSVSHELGHTLNLDHRNGDILALMNTNQQHNGADGRVSNFKIYPTEITEMRQTALDYIPGTYTDPGDKIIQGNAVQAIKVDKVKENKALKPYEDIALSSVTLDKKKNTVSFGQELYGLLPKKSILQDESMGEYWTLVDLDNNKNTGGSKNMLMNISAPLVNISGIDLAILEKVNNFNTTNVNNIIGSAWIFKDNSTLELSPNDVRFGLQSSTIHHGDHADGMKQVPENEIALYDTIYATLNNTNLIKLDSPFSVQSFVISNGKIVDELDYTQDEPKFLELSQPFFPVCHANQDTTVGENVTVNASGLLPKSNIHALLGHRLVANGTTDYFGNSTVKFIILHRERPIALRRPATRPRRGGLSLRVGDELREPEHRQPAREPRRALRRSCGCGRPLHAPELPRRQRPRSRDDGCDARARWREPADGRARRRRGDMPARAGRHDDGRALPDIR